MMMGSGYWAEELYHKEEADGEGVDFVYKE